MFFPPFDAVGMKYFMPSPLCPVALLSPCFEGQSSSGVIIKVFFLRWSRWPLWFHQGGGEVNKYLRVGREGTM